MWIIKYITPYKPDEYLFTEFIHKESLKQFIDGLPYGSIIYRMTYLSAVVFDEPILSSDVLLTIL